MKRKSLLAIFTAAVLLTGCSSSEKPNTLNGGSSDEITNSSAPAGNAGEPGAPSVSADPDSSAETDKVTSADGSASSTAATPDASAAPDAPDAPATTPGSDYEPSAEPDPGTGSGTSSPETTTTAATTTKPVATVGTESHSDPSGVDYTATDIGGTEKHEGAFDIGLAEDAMEIAPEAGFGDVAAADGFIAEGEPGIIPEPCPPYIEPQIPPAAGLLTGGEWNDNENWEFWNGLYDSQNYSVDWSGFKETWRTGADYRLVVTVRDSSGDLVRGAKVSADKPAYSAVTDNEGKAYLFFSESELIDGPTDIKASFGDYSQSDSVILSGDNTLDITLDREVEPAEKTLDFMIMCDTTGSMSDELEYLKEELLDVVTRIKSENANVPTRLSVNFYRDEGDEYVVRSFPFTTDLNAAVEAIGQQYAEGGGDTPEAVHTALANAVSDHDWDENSVKVMFLVLDAPPHDDVQIIDETVKQIKIAAEKGIRVIPVAASGIDKSCEYLLRSMAFMTGGTYAFLTDDSGIGGGHIEPTIGSYDVEKLNDMMVRITGEYLKDKAE